MTRLVDIFVYCSDLEQNLHAEEVFLFIFLKEEELKKRKKKPTVLSSHLKLSNIFKNYSYPVHVLCSGFQLFHIGQK